MSKRGFFRQYLIFTAGLVLTALGISLITKGGLGTSPVSSLPYVLSFLSPLSFGAMTMIVNSCTILAEILILRRRFPPFQLLQLPATLLFSLLIDLWMLLLNCLGELVYAQRIAMVLLGCTVLGLGVAVQVLADVLILPAEGFVRVVSHELGREFGTIKTLFDLSMVSAALLISWAALGAVCGIREGTLIAAVVTGSISRFFRKRLAFLAPSAVK